MGIKKALVSLAFLFSTSPAFPDTGYKPPTLTVTDEFGTIRRRPIQEMKFSTGTFLSVSGNVATVSVTSVTLPAGSTNYLQNRPTLQSGSTAYPDFLYVGASATFQNQIDVKSTATVTDLVIRAGHGIRPSANSTNALNISQADGTNFVTFDTTNKRMKIGDATAPAYTLDVTGDMNVGTGQYFRIGTTGVVYVNSPLANFFMGSSGNATMTGGNNIMLGYATFNNNVGGAGNVGVGRAVFYTKTGGNDNTAVGNDVLFNDLTCAGVTAIGAYAGWGAINPVSDQNSTVDTYMTFLGYRASRGGVIATTTTMTNATAIGANAKVDVSNAMVFGGTGASSVLAGFGVTIPAAKLHQDSGNATATYHKFTAGNTTGLLSTDGFDTGIDGSGNAELRQRENLPMYFYTNNTLRATLEADGDILFAPAGNQQLQFRDTAAYIKSPTAGTLDIAAGIVDLGTTTVSTVKFFAGDTGGTPVNGTTPAKWIKVLDSAAGTYYIPMYQ